MQTLRNYQSPMAQALIIGSIMLVSFIVLSSIAVYLGGGWMIPIALCAVAALGLTLERAFALYVIHNVDMDDAVQKVTKRIEDGDIEGSWEAVEHLPEEPITAVVQGALLTIGASEKELRRKIEEEVMRNSPLLQRRTAYLSVVANVATLLGLLGTIFGLIACFDAISAADPAQKQALLASGIATAMLTTAFGLIVAIPTLLSHAVLIARQDTLLDRFESASVKLFNDLSSFQLARLRSTSKA